MSLVLSLVLMGPIGSTIGVVFGHLALKEIRRSGGRVTGRGMALAGLTLGYIGLVGMVIAIVAAIVTVTLSPAPCASCT